MTKIYFDENGLNSYINNGLQNSISNINDAKSIASVLSIPYDFYYRSYLKNLDDNLKSDLDIVNGIYNKIKDSSKHFNGINNQLNAEIEGIENYSISLRQSAIK